MLGLRRGPDPDARLFGTMPWWVAGIYIVGFGVTFGLAFGLLGKVL